MESFSEKSTKKFTGQIWVNDVVQDITEDSVTIYFMTEPNTTPVVSKVADVSLGDGQYGVTLSKIDTAIIPQKYYYEIWWVLSNGEEYRLESSGVLVLDSTYKD